MAAAALEYLLGNYFHQDLFEVYGGVEQAVAEFVIRDRHRAVHVPEDIEALLASAPSDRRLEDFVTATGCEYDPRPEWGGYRGWLEEIARRVRARLTEQA